MTATGNLIRVRPAWDALKSALEAVSSLGALAGGVHVEGDGYKDPETTGQWGRLVLAPIIIGMAPWDGSGRVEVGLVLRAEQPALTEPGYIPAHGLEAILGAAHAVLDGWTGPIAGGLTRVAFPFYCRQAPQAAPLYDGGRHVWWLSAEYRGELVAT